MYKFKSKECNKHYSHRRNLYRHVRDIHKHIRFPCNYCQKTFITQKTLDNHINKNHTNYNYLSSCKLRALKHLR